MNINYWMFHPNEHKMHTCPWFEHRFTSMITIKRASKIAEWPISLLDL